MILRCWIVFSIVASVFVVIWLAKYPKMFSEILLFKGSVFSTDIVAGILSWIFVGGFVTIVILISEKLIPNK